MVIFKVEKLEENNSRMTFRFYSHEDVSKSFRDLVFDIFIERPLLSNITRGHNILFDSVSDVQNLFTYNVENNDELFFSIFSNYFSKTINAGEVSDDDAYVRVGDVYFSILGKSNIRLMIAMHVFIDIISNMEIDVDEKFMEVSCDNCIFSKENFSLVSSMFTYENHLQGKESCIFGNKEVCPYFERFKAPNYQRISETLFDIFY